MALRALGDDLLAQRDDRAHGNLARFRRLCSKFERPAHRSVAVESPWPGALAERRSLSHRVVRSRLVLGPSGFWTTRVGTLTVVSLVPTFTEPVSTSNAGGWPPLRRHAIARGRDLREPSAGRTWLMFKKPVATPAMMTRIATIRMKMKTRIDVVPLKFKPGSATRPRK